MGAILAALASSIASYRLCRASNVMKKIRLEKLVACYDNGGKTADRYTVVYRKHRMGCSNGKYIYDCVGMSANPLHPQGFGQHGTAQIGKHLGEPIAFGDLPADCQQLVRKDLGLKNHQ